MCETTCKQCVACEKSEVQNHGKSICYDKYGNCNCSYYSLCSMASSDVYACKLYNAK